MERGGVRDVKEIYVGINGVPRLCWSGNKWANKLFSSFSVHIDSVNYNRIYEIDLNTFASTLIHQLANSISVAMGGGFKQMYRMNWNYLSMSTLDMKTGAQVFYTDKLPEEPSSNVEKRAGYLYYRLRQTNQVNLMDANTYAYVQRVFPGVGTTINASFCGANSTGFYMRGWINNDGNLDGIYRVDNIQSAPVQVRVYLTNSGKAGWSFAATDSYIFDAEVGNGPDLSVRKIDINTGVVIQTGATRCDNWSLANIFSPKKLK